MDHTAVENSALQSWAQISPLLAALIAPMTSLLDIPALTQHWYSKYGFPQPDPAASIVLSAVSLGLNLLANVLLVLRFSATARYWHLATVMSLLCWFLKTSITVTNLVIFGLFHRNDPVFEYQEGFWCAVVSVTGSGVITLLLLFHYIFQGRYSCDEESKKIRISGRHFMLSIISLTSLLALQSLIFSRIEGWLYLDTIYFSVVTMLTIGFGDFTVRPSIIRTNSLNLLVRFYDQPTKTVTRILLLPFAVLAIVQLTNQVGMIINFFSQRSQERRSRWRRRYEALQDAREALQRYYHNPDGDLKREVDFLVAQAKRERNLSKVYDLGWSLSALVTFWLVGAAIFSQLEHWPYGDGIYFCYVFFLTIGYGDFVPVSPAGRVIFIVYSLMAVPIVTSFAVQTVIKILGTFSERLLVKQTESHIGSLSENTAEKYLSHAELCLRQHVKLDKRFASIRMRSLSKSQSQPTANDTVDEAHDEQIDVVESPVDEKGINLANSLTPEDNASVIAKDEALKDIDQLLIKRVLQLAVELETQARVLLMHAMPKGSQSEVLLRADMRLQLREVQKLHVEDPDTKLRAEGLVDINAPESMNIDVDERVRRYREIFAALLAAGSKLQRLEGIEQLIWERRARRE